MRATRTTLIAFLAALAPTMALAHTGVDGAHSHGIMSGFMHPVGGLDHILAMVAVGIFAFVLGGRALLMVPLAFIGMMAVGFGLGVAGLDLPFVELGIALSIVVIGGAAALGRPMPLAAAMSLVGVFAIFHGHAHGAEMAAGTSALEYALGFVAATALLHAAGIGAATVVAAAASRYGRPLARIAGGLFALAGAGVLAGWL